MAAQSSAGATEAWSHGPLFWAMQRGQQPGSALPSDQKPFHTPHPMLSSGPKTPFHLGPSLSWDILPKSFRK